MGNYVDEFRNADTAEKIVRAIKDYKGRQLNIMEVCGTHTMSIFRYGIRDLLPENIKLISGPGCPVCVTPVSFIDSAVELAQMEDVIITTFGDLIKVPGSSSSLAISKAGGTDIRIVYSPLDSLEIARKNPDKRVVFLSVGFETTTPVAALTLLKAVEYGIKNFYLLSANKTMPEALYLLAADSQSYIDAYLYPGHVSAIIGTAFYEEITAKFEIPGVVTGFELLDILHAILSITEMERMKKPAVLNEYSRVVKKEGNPVAFEKIYEVFEPCDSIWRGLGNVPLSGLAVREKYMAYDAWKVFKLGCSEGQEPAGCMCGQVLKGRIAPNQCNLYGRICTPETPVGACMVSSEGTCAAFYRYTGCNFR